MGAASRTKWKRRKTMVRIPEIRARWERHCPELIRRTLEHRLWITPLITQTASLSDAGMPRANCPARMGKVKLRNTKWRAGEPLIVEHPLRRLSGERAKKRSRDRLRNKPKYVLDYFALHPFAL